MGNYRFRFSDMMPNAWFYKLKDMSKPKMQKNQLKKPAEKSQKPNISQPRYSYYLTSEPIRHGEFYSSPVNKKASDTHFPDSSSRKSTSRRNSRRKTVYKPSPGRFSSSVSSAGNCTCQAMAKVQQSPDYFISSSESSLEPGEFLESPLCYSEEDFVESCNCEVTSSSTDIIIDINSNEKLAGFDPVSEMELPPILTKPAKFRKSSEQVKAAAAHHQSLSVKIFKQESVRSQKDHRTSPVIRKPSLNSTGIRLRANSPRISRKKIQAYATRKSIPSNSYAKSQRRSLSESFIVVKSSLDPQKDFRDSMEEMIRENNIRNSKDLEDLLACYLSLNSNEYHDLIVKAFEQIWCDMTNLHL